MGVNFHFALDPRCASEISCVVRFADFEPVLDQKDTIVLQHGLNTGTHAQETGGTVYRYKNPLRTQPGPGCTNCGQKCHSTVGR